MLLVLHRTEEHRVLQVDHLRHPPPGGSEEGALRLGRALDLVVCTPQVLADQLGLVLVEGALQVRGQEAVLDIDSRVERQLVGATQDQRLVSGLLGVLREQDGPARIQGGVDVVVTAMHVQCVLGESPRRHLEHHRRELARRVVVLLEAVDQSLARGEVHHPLARQGEGDRAPLGRVLALGLHGDLGVTEDGQVALGVGELEVLPHLGRGGDWVEHPAVGQAPLRVVGNDLVAVGCDADSRILDGGGSVAHGESRGLRSCPSARSHPRGPGRASSRSSL